MSDFEQNFYREIRFRDVVDDMLNYEKYAGDRVSGKVGISFYRYIGGVKTPVDQNGTWSRVSKFFFTRERVEGKFVPRIVAILS